MAASSTRSSSGFSSCRSNSETFPSLNHTDVVASSATASVPRTSTSSSRVGRLGVVAASSALCDIALASLRGAGERQLVLAPLVDHLALNGELDEAVHVVELDQRRRVVADE